MPPPGVLVNALPHRKAYAPGEMLAYSIEWSGIPAGHAVMSVVGGTDASGRKVERLVSIAKSNKVVSLVYRVRDRIMSEIDPVTGVPHRISVEQRHGRRNRIYEVDFDQARRKATSRYQGHEPVTVEIPPNAHDIISCLYYLRSLEGIEPGATKIVDVHEGKKNWRLLVFAEDRERVRVPAGTFDTIRVRAEVRFEGVFFDRGDVRLWLTDDARHVPVRVSIKIKIGEVLSELTNMALPPLAAPEAKAALAPAAVPAAATP